MVREQPRVVVWGSVLVALLALALSLAGGADARDTQLLAGRVADVKDGDTIVVEDRVGQFFTVRFNGIDAPELKQMHGREARDFLGGRITGRSVQVEIVKMDRYGRYVGKVMLDDGADVGLEMIQAGLAWWYQRFAKEQSRSDRAAYERAEREARTQRRGLWQDEQPTPPWDYRRNAGGER